MTKAQFIKYILGLSIVQEMKDDIIVKFNETITKTTKAVKQVEHVYIETLLRDNSEKEIKLNQLENRLQHAKVENIQAVIKKLNSGEIYKTSYKQFRLKK